GLPALLLPDRSGAGSPDQLGEQGDRGGDRAAGGARRRPEGHESPAGAIGRLIAPPAEQRTAAPHPSHPRGESHDDDSTCRRAGAAHRSAPERHRPASPRWGGAQWRRALPCLVGAMAVGRGTRRGGRHVLSVPVPEHVLPVVHEREPPVRTGRLRGAAELSGPVERSGVLERRAELRRLRGDRGPADGGAAPAGGAARARQGAGHRPVPLTVLRAGDRLAGGHLARMVGDPQRPGHGQHDPRGPGADRSAHLVPHRALDPAPVRDGGDPVVRDPVLHDHVPRGACEPRSLPRRCRSRRRRRPGADLPPRDRPRRADHDDAGRRPGHHRVPEDLHRGPPALQRHRRNRRRIPDPDDVHPRSRPGPDLRLARHGLGRRRRALRHDDRIPDRQPAPQREFGELMTTSTAARPDSAPALAGRPDGPPRRRRFRNVSDLHGRALAVRYVVLVLVLVLMLGPLVLPLMAAFKSSGEPIFGQSATLLPEQWSLDAFRTMFAQTNMLRYILNSLVVCALSVGSALVLATVGGYMLSRKGWRGRTLVFLVILSALIFPFESIMLSLYAQ